MNIYKPVILLVRAVWMIAITALLLVAVYVSLGRMMLPRLAHYQQPIEAWLSNELAVEVSANSVTGYWHNFGPGIALEGVKIDAGIDKDAGIRVARIELLLDVPASLRRWRPVFSLIKITGSDLIVKRDAQGAWTVENLALGAEGEKSGALIELLQTLMLQRKVLLRDIGLQIALADDISRAAVIKSGQLQCIESQCSVQAGLEVSAVDKARGIRILANIRNSREIEQLNIESYVEWEPVIVEEWLPLIGASLPVKLQVPHGEVGGRVWLNISKGKVRQVQGDLLFPELQLLAQGQKLQSFASLSSQFNWLNRVGAQEDGWTLRLDKFGFKWRGQQFGPAHLRGDFRRKGAKSDFRLAADSIDLEFAVGGLMAVENVPQKIKDMLRQLQPGGKITHAQLNYHIPDEDGQEHPDEPGFVFKANLSEVAVSAWKHTPQVAGITGYLEATSQGGQLVFFSEDLQVHFPKLYSSGWNFSQASGLINWHNEGRSFWIDGSDIRLETDKALITGQFGLSRPAMNSEPDLEPRLDIGLSVKNSTAHQALSFLPDLKLSESLVGWLKTAMLSGQVTDAAFIYSGSIAKGAPISENVIQLDAWVEQLDFRYHEDWPPLGKARARVRISGPDALIEADQATLMDSQIKQATARYDGASKTVRVNAGIEGPLQDLLRTMQETPVREKLFDLVEDFKLSGAMNLDLGLELPLQDLSLTQTSVSVAMQGARFEIPSLDLLFDNLSGQLEYSTQKGLHGTGITGQFLAEPVAVMVKSNPGKSGSKPRRTTVTMTGMINSQALYAWRKIPALSRLQGRTRYSAELYLGSPANHISLTSNLKGMKVVLPAPYGKDKQQNLPLKLDMELADGALHRLQYGDLVQSVLRFDGTTYTDGQIRLGGGAPGFVASQGLSITGQTAQLDYSEWDTLFRELEQESVRLSAASANKDKSPPPDKGTRAKTFVDYLQHISLDVDSLYLRGKELQNVALRVEQSADDWTVNLQNPEVKARIELYKDSAKSPPLLDIEYLRLPRSADKDSDVLAAVVPQQLMAMNVRIAQFMIGDQDYGTWKFDLRPSDKGARISELVAQVRGLQISGDMDWRYWGGHHRTHFLGMLETKKLGKSLEAWGHAPSIEAKNSRTKGDVSWAGSPANLTAKRLKGRVDWKAEHGRLIEVEGATDALRILGIMNFNSLARRLRLDFSDLFKKGYSFDTLKGVFDLNEGIVTIRESLVIDGPSAKFMIDGTADMNNKTLDQELIVVLPLSENISIAAAIAGAPQVGIPLYLLYKAFGNMFERFASARYLVKGDWDKPEVELVRVFDNKSGPIDQAQEKN